MLDVFSKIRKVASTDIPVIILGESGTGKELTALAVHERSSRKEIFVPINCAAIPEHLLEAELFGLVMREVHLPELIQAKKANSSMLMAALFSWMR